MIRSFLSIIGIGAFLMKIYVVPVQAQHIFIHPGISHKKSDLERMKAMVNAQIYPWYNAYNDLKSNSMAKYDYKVRGKDTCRIIIQDGTNFASFRNDSKAAYLNALMWAITDDSRHAQKCVEIFNAWSNLTCFQGGGTESLNAGRVGWQIIEAAEIIKSTYNGWANSDIQRFKDMLVYPGYSNVAKPSSVNNNNGTFYWRVYQGDAGRHGNQDLFGWRVVMAIGIFLDNPIMFDRAYRYLTKQSHRSDDIPYESGPPIGSSVIVAQTDYLISYQSTARQNKTPDYGYNGALDYYILSNGQSQESSRDQEHAALGIGILSSMAEIAWNQGYDIYSMYDNRILKGYEWAMRYNVSYLQAYPDQQTSWEPTVESGEFIQFIDRTKRWKSLKINPYVESGDVNSVTRGKFLIEKSRPVYEIALAHYGVRAELPADEMKWTQRALDINGLEKLSSNAGLWHDHLGWGGLTFRRTVWMAGDPVSYADGQKRFSLPQVPCTISAVDFDQYVDNGQGHTYSDNSTGNIGNVYRTDTEVDIKTNDDGYVIYNIENGEWTSYTFGVNITGNYDISVHYKTANLGVKIQIAIDGMVCDEVFLPQSNDFIDTKAATVRLEKGAHVIRIYHTESNNSFEFSKLQFVYTSVAPVQTTAINNNISIRNLNGSLQIFTSDKDCIRQIDIYDLRGSNLYSCQNVEGILHNVKTNSFPKSFIIKVQSELGTNTIKFVNN
ncbi:MAG: carbohydrate-binding protein [Paludibacteraceae bacterium]